jgi:hypothetical protein
MPGAGRNKSANQKCSDFGRALQLSRQILVVDLHPVEEPLGIALQNGRDLLADVSAGLAKSVNDPAQMGFIDAQHSRQAVLSNPARVDSQFKVRINFSTETHCLLTLRVSVDLWLLMGHATATT